MAKYVSFLCLFLLFYSGCSRPSTQRTHTTGVPPHFTKSYIQQILNSTSSVQEVLTQEIAYGCVTVPAQGTWSNMWSGLNFTGERCWVKVGPNNTVSVSFLGSHFIPVKSTSTPQYRTDIFVAELANNQVLMVQYLPDGRVISITQTVYNQYNQVVYGQVDGDFIKECIFDRETTKRYNTNHSCP